MHTLTSRNVTPSHPQAPWFASQNGGVRATAAISMMAARMAIAAAALYQLLLFTLIALRPDLDPYWHTISEWAIGPWGWLMQGCVPGLRGLPFSLL